MAGSPLLFILLAMFHLGRNIGRLLFLLLIVLPLLCVAVGVHWKRQRDNTEKEERDISFRLSLSTPFSLHVTLYRAAATSISEKWCNSSLQGLRGDNIRWIISLFVYFFPPFWLEKRLFVLTSFLNSKQNSCLFLRLFLSVYSSALFLRASMSSVWCMQFSLEIVILFIGVIFFFCSDYLLFIFFLR